MVIERNRVKMGPVESSINAGGSTIDDSSIPASSIAGNVDVDDLITDLITDLIAIVDVDVDLITL
jgi:hypothetical protein